MSILDERLDTIYCINLNRREDRWEQFKTLWDPLDLKIEKFSAVDAHNISFEEGSYRNDDEFHSKSSLACALSHIQVLERAIYSGHKEILVLEDDAHPCQQFKERFDVCYNQLPEDYNFCYLGGSNKYPPVRITENVGRAVHTKSTVAYLIKTEFAKPLVQTIKDNLLKHAVDEIYKELQEHLVLHIFTPRLIHQFESYSDILERDIYYHWMKDLD